ncbi:MAG TPA: TolC family outer membrane protein [Dongiaceae bacterium]|nr:TolC family outer membrane protein [Dongiaceae bacterium]
MKKTLTLCSLISVVFLLAPLSASAENLIDIFNLARKNDAQWASKKQKYLAEREKMEQAFGTLLPTAEATALTAKQMYEGGTVGFDINNAGGCLANIITGNDQALEDCLNDQVGTVDVSEDYDITQYGVQVIQPLIRMDRWHRYSRAQILDNAGKADLAYSQQELMIRSSEAYFAVLKAQEELRLVKVEEKVLRTQLTEVKNRYKLGLMRDTDVFETQGQYDIAYAAVIVAEAQVTGLKENLTALTNKEIELISPLPKDIPVDPPQPLELKEWEEFAKRSNYQLVAAQYVSAAAEKEVTEKKAGHAPTADLFFDYTHRDVGGGFTPSSDTTTIGVRVTVPIYSGGVTSSQTREVRYRSESAKDDVELARRNAIRETRQYYTKVMADVASVEARYRAIRSNNSSYRAIKKGWQSGIRSLSDLLGAQRKVFQARKEHSNARYDYILDTLKLKKASGVLTPEDLKTLNSWLDAPSSDTVSTFDDESEDFLKEVDEIKFEEEVKSFEDEKKDKGPKGQKSLYDAYKAWRGEKGN